MNETITQQLVYPYNLFLDVKGNTNLEIPALYSKDIQAGLCYALSTLLEAEQTFIHLYYKEGLSICDISKRLSLSEKDVEAEKRKAVRKLRIPSRWNYIQYGVAGYLKRETSLQYNKGYRIGYDAGYQNGINDISSEKSNLSNHEKLLNQPVEIMNLSPRILRCLRNAGCKRISDLLSLTQRQIMFIHGLGQKGANEIAQALESLGIEDPTWFQFRL